MTDSLNSRFSLRERETTDDTTPDSIRLTFTSMNSVRHVNDEERLEMYMFSVQR